MQSMLDGRKVGSFEDDDALVAGGEEREARKRK